MTDKELARNRFLRFQTVFHGSHIVLGLIVLVLCIFGGLRENYPLLIPLISGMMIGFVTHHSSLLVLTITTIYVPAFDHVREMLSRYLAVLGLVLWLLLYVMDTQGRLLIHGYGLYIFMNLFNATATIVWDICLAHCGLDRRTAK